MTSDAPAAALGRLRGIIRGYGSAIVAYSGGVDSALVLTIARDELGERSLGCIGNSPAYSASELAAAKALAERHHLSIRVIETTEHLDPLYAANAGDRCFHCRSHLFRRLRGIATECGFAEVLDGIHVDDAADHVGGITSAHRHGVRSPLLEAGIGKSTVREIACQIGLGVWDKPAMACLASRIPIGTAVTIPLLEKIERAEECLRALKFCDFRVRHHGNLARIELADSDIPRALLHRSEILTAIRAIGYEHVTLDLHARQTSASSPPTGAIPLELS